jgi:cytochrome c556
VGVALIAALAACGHSGATSEGARAAEAREANFKKIAKANKAIGDELKKPSPAIAILQANAGTIDQLAPQVPHWFPAGSGPESGARTEALPAIWQRPEDFARKAADFAAAARTLQAAAAGGDIANVWAAAPAVGASCKGCHEQFRQKK